MVGKARGGSVLNNDHIFLHEDKPYTFNVEWYIYVPMRVHSGLLINSVLFYKELQAD